MNLLVWVKHVVKDNTAARHGVGDRHWLGSLRLGFENLSLSICGRGVISSCKLSHESIPAIVVKVDTRHVGIIESASTTSLLVVTSAGTIEIGGWCTTASRAREGGSLKLWVVLTLESLQEVGSGFGGKLIVAKSDPDGATCEVKPIHLLQGLTSLTSVSESVICVSRYQGQWKEEWTY